MKDLRIRRLGEKAALINGKVHPLHCYQGLRPKCFYGPYVIKFDDLDDYHQSTREIEIWKLLRKEDRRYFVPLVGWSRKQGYVVQPRIRFRRGRRPAWAWETIKIIVARYDLVDVSKGVGNDNWAMSEEGHPVIYDWGVVEDYYV